MLCPELLWAQGYVLVLQLGLCPTAEPCSPPLDFKPLEGRCCDGLGHPVSPASCPQPRAQGMNASRYSNIHYSNEWSLRWSEDKINKPNRSCTYHSIAIQGSSFCSSHGWLNIHKNSSGNECVWSVSVADRKLLSQIKTTSELRMCRLEVTCEVLLQYLLIPFCPHLPLPVSTSPQFTRVLMCWCASFCLCNSWKRHCLSVCFWFMALHHESHCLSYSVCKGLMWNIHEVLMKKTVLKCECFPWSLWGQEAGYKVKAGKHIQD